MAEPTQLEAKSKRGKPTPGLYLVATPIGNLSDITLRALTVLEAADLIACEDTRVTRKLLTHHGIAAGRRLRTYNQHVAGKEQDRLLSFCRDGGAVALVCDAGAPLISDPGLPLLRAAAELAIPVTSLPGPSAPLAALQLSGLPTLPFYCAGFLPAKASQRRREIARLAPLAATLVLFEAPHRVAGCLADLAQGLGPRPAALVREITKRFEEVRRGELAELAQGALAAPPKGEIVLAVGPAEAREEGFGDSELEARLREALEAYSLRDAVARVAAASGEPRRRVYSLALDLEKGALEKPAPEKNDGR